MYKEIILNEKITPYLIHDDGRLFNKKTNHFLKGSISCGYRRYQLTFEGKAYNMLAHRLVAEYFLEKIDGYNIVYHKDGNKLNNHVNNLQWVNDSINLAESYAMGRKNNQTINKITEEEIQSKEWRQIENTQYFISEDGIVYNKNTMRKLKLIKNNNYLRVTYYLEKQPITESIHRLVYKYFINKEIVGEIDHIDGNRFNNHYSNLRDVTSSENKNNFEINQHKGRIPVRCYNNEEEKKYPSIAAAARDFNCQPALIRRAIKNKNMTHDFYWEKIDT